MQDSTLNQELVATVKHNGIFYTGEETVLKQNQTTLITVERDVPDGTSGVILSITLSNLQIFLIQNLFSSAMEEGFIKLRLHNLNSFDIILEPNQFLGRIVHF